MTVPRNVRAVQIVLVQGAKTAGGENDSFCGNKFIVPGIFVVKAGAADSGGGGGSIQDNMDQLCMLLQIYIFFLPDRLIHGMPDSFPVFPVIQVMRVAGKAGKLGFRKLVKGDTHAVQILNAGGDMPDIIPV